ncbi:MULTISPECIES: competence protein CoiA family protein [unclassified Thioalkalivibrio]|uniref:competence protein CoiA family protein n=1 Tax=unclassified Thioalkalivibrio TaxID=2621013 RepID=UPI00036F9231|nr:MULTISPECIES: competence protein CoiA family protein [unclassified Thioalkalivibrio]
MEKPTLLQSFALNNEGQIVSIHDVAKGKACECCCPECGETVIARQGQIRQWHFAHSSGTDCDNSGEGALHQAAKQILMDEKWVTLPLLPRKLALLEDELRDSGCELVPPNRVAVLQSPDAEVTFADGLARVDVAAVYAGKRILIEIAVSHLVEPRKNELLATLGYPAMEIHLPNDPNLEWTWDLLRQQVLEDPGNRKWLCHPILQSILDEHATTQKSETKPSYQEEKWRWEGVPMAIRTYPWGVTVWSAYNEAINARLKETSQYLGGRWSKRYKTWSYAPGVKGLLEEALRARGARKE